MTELNVIDAESLQATPMNKPRFIVQDLIPHGVTILSGASKIGKSWLMLWLGIQVALGNPVWGLPVSQCDVFYFSLEDTERRLKDRLFELAKQTDLVPSNLRFSVNADLIGHGLENQMERILTDFPDTKLFIVDTLQKVRESRGSSGRVGMYGNDYDDISSIKRIADQFDVAVILVHHLRKMRDSDDPFNEVSGSTGIIGAADTNLILKRKRSSRNASLLVSGRDVEYQELTLEFQNLMWTLVDRRNSDQIHQDEIPVFLFRISDFMNGRPEWCGTATELLNEMKETEVSPNMVTRYLGQFACEVLEPLGITYQTKRTGNRRLLRLLWNSN